MELKAKHTQRQWEGKFFRCQSRCYYCQIPLLLAEATKDHLIPTSRGGRDTIDNIVPACLDCNRLKGELTEQEFRDERKRFSIEARNSTAMSFLPEEIQTFTQGNTSLEEGATPPVCDHGITACLECGQVHEAEPDTRLPRPVEEIELLRAVEKERNAPSLYWRKPA